MGTLFYSQNPAETLFSKNRRAILALLFDQPDQEFYLRQVVRLTGGGLGAIQRELKLLTVSGILKRTVRHNRVYYQTDAECPIFEELKKIIAKTAGAADILRTALTPLGERIHVAFIFGSYARAATTPASDVDLLVVGGVAFTEIVAALADAQTKIGRDINPTVYPPEEFRAKILAGHHFLKSLLPREKIYLIGDERELKRLVK
jgi:uncharacterized protein